MEYNFRQKTRKLIRNILLLEQEKQTRILKNDIIYKPMSSVIKNRIKYFQHVYDVLYRRRKILSTQAELIKVQNRARTILKDNFEIWEHVWNEHDKIKQHKFKNPIALAETKPLYVYNYIIKYYIQQEGPGIIESFIKEQNI